MFSRNNLSMAEMIELARTGNSNPNVTPGPFRYITDDKLVDKVQDYYAKAMDVIGLNLKDPSVAYMKYFNKSQNLLGIDPQRAGRSHVFFTRPDLNFGSEINRASVPYFDYAYNNSLGRAVMSLLMYPESRMEPAGPDKKFYTPSPFDPLRSNLCREVGSGKDFVMERDDIEPNLSGDQLSYAGGADGIESIGEVSIQFEDVVGSPIFMEHVLWFLYMHHLVKGSVKTKLRYEQDRIIDYTCSIYVFRLAEDNKTIIRFGKYTGCFPIMVPMSTLKHSYEIDSEDLRNFSITYAYNRYEPMNPEIFIDMNYISKDAAMRNQSVSKDGDNYSVTLNPKTHEVPDRKLNPVNPISGWRSDHWSIHPYIIGNKLIFI